MRYKCYKYDMRHTSFNELNTESLYWIGFLFADGYTKSDKDRGNRIKLELQVGDADHVQKFMDFIGTSKKYDVYTRMTRGKEHGVCRIELFSEDIIKKLYSYGIKSPKRDIIVSDERILNSIDFWRGYIDGDGCWSGDHNYTVKGEYYYYPKLQIASENRDVLEKFKLFASGICGKVNTSVINVRGRNTKKIGINGKQAATLAKTLYYDNCVGLDRKVKQVKEFLDIYYAE